MVARIVITGCTSLIGRALVEELRDSYDIVLLARKETCGGDVPEGAEIVWWDAKTIDGWTSALEGADAIINLAGANLREGRWSARRKRELKESRLDAGCALVAAIRQLARKPRCFMQASTIGYYGADDLEKDEMSSPGADFLANLAVEWEASTASLEACGIRRIIGRFAFVLSCDGGMLPKILARFRHGLGGRNAGGMHYYSWIHIKDLVRAIRFLIEHDVSGPYNLVSPFHVRDDELATIFARRCQTRSWCHAPKSLLRVLLGERSSLLLDSHRASSKKLQQAGFEFLFPTMEGALDDLLAKK